MPHPTVNTTSILCKVKQFITEFLSVSIGISRGIQLVFMSFFIKLFENMLG